MKEETMFRKPLRFKMSIPGGSTALLALAFILQACSPAAEGDAPMEARQERAVAVEAENETGSPSRLAVLWTSGDREVALKVAFMYTLNAKRQGWFDEVTLIVWGPSSQLLSGDAELQAQVQGMAEAGVEVVACKACADLYGVSEVLAGMGIDVKYMGRPLTDMLQGDWKVITF
jgi:hypothetical protein